MTLRKLFFCGAACGLALLASCSNSGSGDENEIATQVADGTIPPWIAESGDEGGYHAVSSDAPATYKSNRKASISSSTKASKSSKGKTSRAVASSSKSKSSKTAAKSTKSRPRATYYTVQKGDSIDRIARRNKTSNKALMKANGLKSDLIHPGQKLRIP